MFTLRVYGEPIPKGSTRAFVVGDRAVTTNANAKTKNWQNLISLAAQELTPDMIEGAVSMSVSFYLTRPKSVKRQYHTVRPDLDKLLRCVLDSLTGIVFKDDSQVVVIAVEKSYAEGKPGVLINAWEVVS
jgi:crossover junction endodeoxyribonuclease RusA